MSEFDPRKEAQRQENARQMDLFSIPDDAAGQPAYDPEPVYDESMFTSNEPSAQFAAVAGGVTRGGYDPEPVYDESIFTSNEPSAQFAAVAGEVTRGGYDPEPVYDESMFTSNEPSAPIAAVAGGVVTGGYDPEPVYDESMFTSNEPSAPFAPVAGEATRGGYDPEPVYDESMFTSNEPSAQFAPVAGGVTRGRYDPEPVYDESMFTSNEPSAPFAAVAGGVTRGGYDPEPVYDESMFTSNEPSAPFAAVAEEAEPVQAEQTPAPVQQPVSGGKVSRAALYAALKTEAGMNTDLLEPVTPAAEAEPEQPVQPAPVKQPEPMPVPPVHAAEIPEIPDTDFDGAMDALVEAPAGGNDGGMAAAGIAAAGAALLNAVAPQEQPPMRHAPKEQPAGEDASLKEKALAAKAAVQEALTEQPAPAAQEGASLKEKAMAAKAAARASAYASLKSEAGMNTDITEPVRPARRTGRFQPEDGAPEAPVLPVMPTPIIPDTVRTAVPMILSGQNGQVAPQPAPVQNVQPAPVQQSVPVQQPAAPVKAAQPVQNVQQSAPVQNVQPAPRPAPVQQSAPVQQPAAPVKAAQPVQTVQPAPQPAPVQQPAPAQQPAAPVKAAQPLQQPAPLGDTRPYPPLHDDEPTKIAPPLKRSLGGDLPDPLPPVTPLNPVMPEKAMNTNEPVQTNQPGQPAAPAANQEPPADRSQLAANLSAYYRRAGSIAAQEEDTMSASAEWPVQPQNAPQEDAPSLNVYRPLEASWAEDERQTMLAGEDADGYQVRTDEQSRPGKRRRKKRMVRRAVVLGIIALLLAGMALLYLSHRPDETLDSPQYTAAPTPTPQPVRGYDAATALKVSDTADEAIGQISAGVEMTPCAVTAENVLNRSQREDGLYDFYLFSGDGQLLGYYDGLKQDGMCPMQGGGFYVDMPPYLVSAEGNALISVRGLENTLNHTFSLRPIMNGYARIIADDGESNFIDRDGRLLSRLWFCRSFSLTGTESVAYVDTGVLQSPSRYTLYILSAKNGGSALKWKDAADAEQVVTAQLGMAYLQNGELYRLSDLTEDLNTLPLCIASQVRFYLDCNAMVVQDAATGKYALYVGGEKLYDAVYDSILPVESDVRWKGDILPAQIGQAMVLSISGASYPQPLSYYFVLSRDGVEEHVALSAVTNCPILLD